MNSVPSYRSFARRRKREVNSRLKKAAPLFNSDGPTLGSGPIHFDTSERIRAISCAGIGAIHNLVNFVGLPASINEHVKVLKQHRPYYESDHVLNIAYNGMLGGQTLEDIELRRNDPAYLDALGVASIPDPTTAGDFTRRFTHDNSLELQDAFHDARRKVWAQQPKRFLKTAVVDFDGTIVETGARCKQGVDISYKGKWGYQPLIVTLANTREVLWAVNRSGNAKSSDGFEAFADQAIELLEPYCDRVLLRGDTDFYRGSALDVWTEKADFVFGAKGFKNLVGIAESLEETAWTRFEREPKYAVGKSGPRKKPENVREGIVKERGYENLKLKYEDIAEFKYTPSGCKRAYRMVVVRKNISRQKGEELLFDEIRYLFYITNLEAPAEEIVGLANGRCDQENIIEQAKNGIAAMRMPVDSLEANEAYMVMMLLGLSLKSWLGLLMPDRASGLEVVRMEYRRFFHQLIMIPAQVVRSGRQVTLRFLASSGWLIRLCSTWERLLAGT